MKTKALCLILVVPLFTSGCFTGARHWGEAWGGGSSKSAVVETTTLDILTFPIQAPVVVPWYLSYKADESTQKHRAEREAEALKTLMPLLEKDPTLALNERWDLKKDMHQWVFVQSFSNPKVKYTDALLEAIHQTCPSVRDVVFRSPSCSKEFLVRHFDEEFERASNSTHQGGLVNLVSNPKTPLDLVEKVAKARGFQGGVTMSTGNSAASRRLINKNNANE